MAFCSCGICRAKFNGDKAHNYSDNEGLDHHPKCNHILEKEIHREQYYDEELQDIVILYEWYYCTCDEEYAKEEEEE